MTVIIKSKTTFDIVQLDNVTNIAYNAGTKVYTITVSGGSTSTYSSDNYYLSVFLI